MPTLSQINQTLEESGSLKFVAEAYSEIAALKLQKIRAGIERNRNFFEEVSRVFRMVKVVAFTKKITLKEKKKNSISLLLTSNHRFYGNIEERLVRYYAKNTADFPTERMVTGVVAKEFLQASSYSYPFSTHLFKDDLPSLEEIRVLSDNLKDYEQILVYYPRMQSVLLQEPYMTDLLQKPPERLLDPKENHFDSIFEPEIEQILQFFDTQIIMLLLEQIFLESELARTASRLIAMEQAQGNAEELISQQRKTLLQVKRSLDSTKQLEAVATLMNFRRGHISG